MTAPHRRQKTPTARRVLVAATCAVAWLTAGVLDAQTQARAPAPGVAAVPDLRDDDQFLKQLLATNVTPIDLLSALRLAGEQNSEILLAQQRVTEAVALRQLAAAQFLPTINAGSSENSHRGTIQQSDGRVIRTNRDSLYVGAGALAVGAGTVNIPGVSWTMNLSQGIYDFLVSRQEVERTAFAGSTVAQDTLLAVSRAYIDLARAEGQHAVAVQVRNEAAEVARLTAAYLKSGEGRKADADRAAAEFERREAAVTRAAGQVGAASAGLCRMLHLDPSLRLHAMEEHVLPKSIVPEPIPLPELLAIALLNRPELQERRVASVQALLRLDESRWLTFSPTVYIAYSAGSFGGGSSTVAAPPLDDPRFGNFSGRRDFDAMAYWTLLNLGVGNQALIDAARSRLRGAEWDRLVVLDRVRVEVAAAYAKTHARFAQIRTCELAITSGDEALHEDMNRIVAHQGRPIEVVDSLRLLARSRVQYLDAILDYNRAQFELYVAIGKPPADLLIRRADENGADPAATRVPPVPK